MAKVLKTANGNMIKVNKEYASNNKKLVHVGEHDYPYVKIGDQYWLQENLYELIDGATFADPSEGASAAASKHICWACFDKDDFTSANPNKDDLGTLYYPGIVCNASGPTTAMQEIIPDGWRVPTQQDALSLLTEGGSALANFTPGGSTHFEARWAGCAAYSWKYSTGTTRSPSAAEFNQCLYILDNSQTNATAKALLFDTREKYPPQMFGQDTEYRISLRLCADVEDIDKFIQK